MKSITENLPLSILDLFSVLLPGAVGLALLYQLEALQKGAKGLLAFLNDKAEWQANLAFIVMAYTLGHILFFLGSFLDKYIDKPTKFYEWGNKDLLKQVNVIKNRHLGYSSQGFLNGFQWAKAQFLVKYPAVYTLIEYREATSKFFRTLCIAFLLGLGVFIGIQKFHLAWFCLFCTLLALWMYLYQRNKVIRITCEHLLVVSGAMLAEFSGNVLPNDLRLLNAQIGEAELKQDTDFFISLLSEDLVFRRANTQINSKAQFLKTLPIITYDYLQTEIGSIKESEDGQSAVVIAQVKTGGKIEGKPFEGVLQNLRFFRRDLSGQWKLQTWYNESK